MITDELKKISEEHKKVCEKTFDQLHCEVLEQIVREILKAFKSGNKLLICGNGGSAADSQHIAAEFIGRFNRERRSLPAVALTTDTSILTAIGNDYGYEKTFSRQVEGLGVKGDVLIAISTSGNSKNVLEAVRAAKEKSIVTIALTGETGGQLGSLADITFKAASQKTPHIQEMHITVLHAVSEIVENTLFA